MAPFTCSFTVGHLLVFGDYFIGFKECSGGRFFGYYLSSCANKLLIMVRGVLICPSSDNFIDGSVNWRLCCVCLFSNLLSTIPEKREDVNWWFNFLSSEWLAGRMQMIPRRLGVMDKAEDIGQHQLRDDWVEFRLLFCRWPRAHFIIRFTFIAPRVNLSFPWSVHYFYQIQSRSLVTWNPWNNFPN